jgi:shikimate kinase
MADTTAAAPGDGTAAEPGDTTGAGTDGPGDARHVVLVGLMGVGKSTVGRRLAKVLERPFADVDEQVELRAGLTIPVIFRTQGEDRFRRTEAEVFADLLARPAPLVVAAGGGAVTGAANRAALARAGAYVVWLRASAEFLAGRTDPTHRPLLADDPEPTLARLLAERAPLYQEVADVEVDVEPFHVADEKPKRALARHIAGLVTGTPVVAG